MWHKSRTGLRGSEAGLTVGHCWPLWFCTGAASSFLSVWCSVSDGLRQDFVGLENDRVKWDGSFEFHLQTLASLACTRAARAAELGSSMPAAVLSLDAAASYKLRCDAHLHVHFPGNYLVTQPIFLGYIPRSRIARLGIIKNFQLLTNAAKLTFYNGSMPSSPLVVVKCPFTLISKILCCWIVATLLCEISFLLLKCILFYY